MLSEHDVGLDTHILCWLSTKKETETYVWASGQCPAAQYSREFGDTHSGLNLTRINALAKIEPHTWGALTQRAQ